MLNHKTSIPLFPLNIVLFPGIMLPLHIFENRYKVMIKECLVNDQPFGIVLARTQQAQAPNVAGLYLDDLYPVGTTARITAVEHLQDDRMNLITVGQERFIIKGIVSSKDDFLVGEVDPFPIAEDEDPTLIQGMMQKLRPLVKEYIDYLACASGEDLSNTALPNDPKTLAYLAGTAVQGPLSDKQDLLSAKSVGTLIARTVNVLDRENKILAYMLKAYQTHQQLQKLPFVDYSLN
jgi:Lon protease-like protein